MVSVYRFFCSTVRVSSLCICNVLPLVLLAGSHAHGISFHSQGSGLLQASPRPAQQPAAGTPEPCPQINVAVTKDLAVLLQPWPQLYSI